MVCEKGCCFLLVFVRIKPHGHADGDEVTSCAILLECGVPETGDKNERVCPTPVKSFLL